MSFLKVFSRKRASSSAADVTPSSPSSDPSTLTDASSHDVSPSGHSGASSYVEGAGGVAGPPAVAAKFEQLLGQGFDHLRYERLDRAAAALEEAAELTPDLAPGQPQISELYALLALTRLYGDDLEGVSEALETGKMMGAGADAMPIRQVEARLLLAQGENAAAGEFLSEQKSPPSLEARGPAHYLSVMAESWKALALDSLGRVDEAQTQFERAEKLAAESPYVDLKATATLNRADSAIYRGDLALAERLSREVIELARGRGDGALGPVELSDSLSYGLSVLGRALRLQEKPEGVTEAEGILTEALSLSEGDKAGRWNRSSVLADLALIKVAQGELPQARDLAHRCDEAAEHSTEPGRVAEAQAVWADLALAEGNPKEAIERYQAAIDIYQQTGDTDLQAQLERERDALAPS